MFSFVGNLKLFIMEAKELRIGNYVYYQGNVEKCFSLRNSGVDFYRGKTKNGIITQGYVYDAIQPIPLTEEILLKCGFIRRWNAPAMLINYGELQSVFTINIVKNEFYFTYGDLQVKHLHQLQNLYFALTNEELTVNL